MQRQQSTAFLIAQARSRVRQHVGDRARAHNLTATQFWLLVGLDDVGPSPLGCLANRVCIDAPTASRVAETLVARGLVRADPDPADRRRSCLTLTEAGAALVEELRPAALEIRAAVVRGFSAEEEATLRALLTRVLANLERPG